MEQLTSMPTSLTSKTAIIDKVITNSSQKVSEGGVIELGIIIIMCYL